MKLGKHGRNTKVVNCYIEGNSKGDPAISFNADGTIDLNLDGYYIVPKDKYVILSIKKVIKYGSR